MRNEAQLQGEGTLLEAAVSSNISAGEASSDDLKQPGSSGASWTMLDVRAREPRRSDLLRRLLWAAVLICVLPPLCALLLLPFFYRREGGATDGGVKFEDTQIFSLPEAPAAEGTGVETIYDWLRMADPRQCLLPDTRAGFSRFLRFEPHYTVEPFPVFQPSRGASQPQYDELFSRIAPQNPRTIVNEQIHRLWQTTEPRVRVAAEAPAVVRTGLQRPVWRLADGTMISVAEEPKIPSEVLEHWRLPETRQALAGAAGRTMLEIEVLSAATLPRVADIPLVSDPPIGVARVALRNSCGDTLLDQAAVGAVRELLAQRASALRSAPRGSFGLEVDWLCW